MKDIPSPGCLQAGFTVQDLEDGLTRFFAIANNIYPARIVGAVEQLHREQEQERWRTDPLGLMWVFRLPELVMLSIAGWSADALEAIANHLLTISSTIRRRL